MDTVVLGPGLSLGIIGCVTYVANPSPSPVDQVLRIGGGILE
ncbi:MAG: hypothetical protein KatS3mg021_2667 [Fimbriimonadales bacterium]|nr:MAG: hypothetical protein KatS3mg021_2667 [Fimbriimonadales bacterium]